MRKMIGIFLAFLLLSGCSAMTQIEKQTDDGIRSYGTVSIENWSLRSGYYTCAMGASPLKFPMLNISADDLMALTNNPVVVTGIAQLDAVTVKAGYWKDKDWAIGCVAGGKNRMTVSQVTAAIKVGLDIFGAVASK